MWLQFIAHAGHDHGETEIIESTSSGFEQFLSVWYQALPAFIVASVALGALLYFLFQKSVQAAYIGVTGFLLLSGVLLYEKSEIISIFAITIGLASTLFVTLAGIAADNKTR